jgi:predicted dinucleotide-binding enzyme
MRGTRDPAKLADWTKKAGPKASVGTFSETAKYGDLVVLAAKGTAAESALRLCGTENLAGKTVIDAMNPIADEPPVNGVLRYFTGPDESLMERLQAAAPQVHFVKAFSCVGSAYMVNPDFGGTTPTMFICGNIASAKAEVGRILERFGWEPADMGGVEAARAIEPLAALWCIPGILRGDWGPRAIHLLRR